MFQTLAISMTVVLFLGSLAGCLHAALQEAPAQELLVEAPRDLAINDGIERLLDYGTWLRSVRPQDLEQEYAGAVSALEDDATAVNRLRLSMLLTLPGVPFQDLARAREYLDQIINEPDEDAQPYQSLARFMKTMLDERRQAENVLAEERRQRQALQQKLEQLKVIEQDTGTRIPPKPMKEN